MNGRTLKIAGIQMSPLAEPGDTLSRTKGLIALAAEKGASIACLPQLFHSRWFPANIDKNAFSIAEPEDGPAVTAAREAAANGKITVIAPVFEKDGGEHFSTAFVIDPSGNIAGKYRKVHVPQIPLWEERAYFKSGNLGFPVFTVDNVRIGVLICWDVFFPEAFRVLALSGAEVVFAPTASAFFHSRHKWERAVQASAHANGLFVMRVNRVGKDGELEFYGRSFCAGPDGEFVVKPAGASEGIVLASVDLGVAAAVKSEWVFLKDRLPSEYKKISDVEGV